MAYIYDLVDTWNDGATTFTAVKMNVTDTASNASSLLMDLQVGGASKFKVYKIGTLEVQTGNGQDAIWTGFGTSSFGSSITVNGTRTLSSIALRAATVEVSLRSTGVYAWTNNTQDALATMDTFLTRRAAANLRLGAADAAAPVAQTLSVQSVVAGTTNTAGTNLTITGSQGTGTGAGGSIIFQVAPAGSTGTAQNALATALTINSAKNAVFAGTIALGDSATATLFKQVASDFIEAGTGFSMAAGGVAGVSMMSGQFNAGPTAFYGWNNANGVSVSDVRLYRDAAATLALRNGTAAQTFRVYNTYTSATEFERGNIFWDSNALKIGTEKGANGGTARALEFQTDGVTRLSISTNGSIGSIGYLAVQPSGFTNASILDNSGNIQTVSGGAITFSSSATNAGGSVDTTIKRGGATGIILLGNSLTPTDFNRLQFGGTTSSFPALKRNATALETKLADDSAYAPHAMQYLDVTDGVTAPASATGRARIYVDTADGDLKVIFADGTVKTIVTDT